MKDLVIFGTGAVGRLAQQIAADINLDTKTWNLIGFLDENIERHDTKVNGFPVLGDVGWLKQHLRTTVVVAVGQSATRRRIVLTIRNLGYVNFATLVHPWAWVASRVSIGVGTILYPGALVDPDVKIGSHVIVNKGDTIGHDTVIGDYATIGPGVNVGGGVTIGEGCDLGINSSTIQKISIGHWSVIGAGAVIVNDVPPNVTAVGIPARPIKERSEGWYKEF